MSNNNSTRIKQVFFIDSAVPDSDVIVANLATDTVYYRLDASQNGLQQMADSLSGYFGLDAIHVISHGAPGSLRLGNGVVTQTTLDDCSAALSTIGNALTETGDLLLYGCDVAQGDVGQAFIQQLAVATGADVAASVDLTGAQAQGGNWILEAQTGDISTTANAFDSYQDTLSVSSNGTLSFFGNDLSIFGAGALNFENDILNYSMPTITLPELNLPGDSEFSFQMDYFKFGLFFNAGISGGIFDLLYPVDYSVKLPSNVRPGDTFTIDTTLNQVTNPQFKIDGPSLDLSAKAVLDAKMTAGLDTTIFGQKWNPSLALSGKIEYSLFDLANTEILSGDKDYFGGALTLKWKLDPNALDGELLVGYADEKPEMELTASSNDPYVALQLDIDDLFPQTALADQTISVPGAKVEMGAFSMDAILSASPYLKGTVNIDGVQVTLTPSQGNSVTGMLGDYFQLALPSDYVGTSYSVSADYKILGDVTFDWGFQLEGGLEIKFGEFNWQGTQFPGFGGVDAALVKLGVCPTSPT